MLQVFETGTPITAGGPSHDSGDTSSIVFARRASIMAEYHQIAYGFSLGIGIQEFLGPVVVSSQTMYLFIQVNATAVMGAMHGLAGALLTSALQELTKPKEDSIQECEAVDLPAEITGHPDWPKRARPTKGLRVVAIPRSAIESMRHPWWGSLQLRVNGQRLNVKVSFFRRKKTIMLLQQLGYPIS